MSTYGKTEEEVSKMKAIFTGKLLLAYALFTFMCVVGALATVASGTKAAEAFLWWGVVWIGAMTITAFFMAWAYYDSEM